MTHFYSNIEQTLSEKVKMRTITQRNNFYEFFRNRYLEFLPSVISYEGLKDKNVLIDPIQLEVWLRQGYGVAIGQTKKGTMLLGTVNQSNTISNIQTYGTRPLTGNDINFFISNKIKEKFYKEITYHDGYETGNFVVLWNKPIQLTNDFNIIETYSERIAEIAMSRFSIYMQAKISTVIRGEANDEDVEQITQDLYNGAPYIKTSKFFDPEVKVLSVLYQSLNESTKITLQNLTISWVLLLSLLIKKVVYQNPRQKVTKLTKKLTLVFIYKLEMRN